MSQDAKGEDTVRAAFMAGVDARDGYYVMDPEEAEAAFRRWSRPVYAPAVPDGESVWIGPPPGGPTLPEDDADLVRFTWNLLAQHPGDTIAALPRKMLVRLCGLAAAKVDDDAKGQDAGPTQTAEHGPSSVEGHEHEYGLPEASPKFPGDPTIVQRCTGCDHFQFTTGLPGDRWIDAAPRREST